MMNLNMVVWGKSPGKRYSPAKSVCGNPRARAALSLSITVQERDASAEIESP
jgi:hypothetical protein